MLSGQMLSGFTATVREQREPVYEHQREEKVSGQQEREPQKWLSKATEGEGSLGTKVTERKSSLLQINKTRKKGLNRRAR